MEIGWSWYHISKYKFDKERGITLYDSYIIQGYCRYNIKNNLKNDWLEKYSNVLDGKHQMRYGI